MSTIQNLSFHAGEPWYITFGAHDDAGDPIPLISGVDVEFRVGSSAGIVFTKSISGGTINIEDEAGGIATILITKEELAEEEVTSDNAYFYEIRVTEPPEWISIQAEGRVFIASSLFAATQNALLLDFRARFPEFDQDDTMISIHLQDAARIVDADDSWRTEDIPIAKVYLAAHLLQMSKTAYDQYASGIEAGRVQSIRVEDRMVAFQREIAGTASTKFTFGETVYGQRYLSMLRRNVILLKRM